MSFSEWTRYFESIAEFLQGASRQYGVANESFTDYVVERLDLCISTCSTVREQLTLHVSRSPSQPDGNENMHGEEVIIMRYGTELQSLVDCLMDIQFLWMRYREMLDARVDDFSFQVDTTRTLCRGRLRFNVSKQQLEYLSSLGFSWTEVASLLGVSRMTIYRYIFVQVNYVVGG